MKKMRKKNIRCSLSRLAALGLCLALICCAFAGCGKTGKKDLDGSGGTLTKVTLNEVAHSILYPYKNNTV